MVQIAVHGSAARSLPAERGTLRLALRVEHEDRAAALHAVTALHARCAADAEGFVRSNAATRWTGDQVRVRAEHRYDRDGVLERVVQIASAEVRVRFRDFTALSGWVDTIGDDPGVMVDGVDWTLTTRTREGVQREVRVAAVQDAVARAEAYAGAIGGAGVVLQTLWEPGLRPGATDGGGEVLLRAMVDPAGVELRPADIAVEAAVTADFLVEPPA